MDLIELKDEINRLGIYQRGREVTAVNVTSNGKYVLRFDNCTDRSCKLISIAKEVLHDKIARKQNKIK